VRERRCGGLAPGCGLVGCDLCCLPENAAACRSDLCKKQQMDAPVQYVVLAEIPATNPADAHSTKKFKKLGLCPASTAPLSRLPLVSYKLLHSSYHIASSCVPRLRRPERPRFRGWIRRLRRPKRRRRFGLLRLLAPPSLPPGNGALGSPCAFLYASPLHTKKEVRKLYPHHFFPRTISKTR
jgi:hypothetical protein